MDIGDIRVANLRDLMRTGGLTQADLAREMDTNPAYISQILNRHGGRRMGSKLARRIEQAYGRPRGWMDHDHSGQFDRIADSESGRGGVSEDALTVGRMFDRLPAATRVHLRALIEQLVGPIRTSQKRRK